MDAKVRQKELEYDAATASAPSGSTSFPLEDEPSSSTGHVSLQDQSLTVVYICMYMSSLMLRVGSICFAWLMYSDDEDDPWYNYTPNTPEFKMMEKEIEERHAKQREQRLVAERRRLEGNEHFKNKQYSEALKTYCLGMPASRCMRMIPKVPSHCHSKKAITREKYPQNSEIDEMLYM